MQVASTVRNMEMRCGLARDTICKDQSHPRISAGVDDCPDNGRSLAPPDSDKAAGPIWQFEAFMIFPSPDRIPALMIQ